jgi:diguanylate cyclase (GGDEF)-like protein
VSTEHRDQRDGPHRLLLAAARALARGDAGGSATLLGLAASELGAERAAVFARDPDREDLALVTSVGPEPAGPDEATVVAAVQARPTFGRASTVDGAAGTAVDLPLVVSRGGVELGLGALSLRWAGPRIITDDDASVLAALADLVAVALDRARLATLADSRADQADRLAMMDGLTGLANARTLDRVLELELARAERQSAFVSVAVFDIDGFGGINERAGHEGGDQVLREVAAALAGSVRLVDTVGRTGGDEFVVVAPGPAGRTVAERILEAVASLPAQTVGRVSVSAGLARYPDDGTTGEALLDAARGALERARAEGAGRIAGGDALPA